METATCVKPSAVIVNDDPTQLRLASTILARDGFEVLLALGVEEALRILQERGTVDVIIIGVNGALENLAAVSRDDIVGKSIARLMATTSFADVMGHQEQARFNKETSWQYETELVRSDGSVLPVDAHCRFLPGQDAQPSTILVMYRDITQQKQLERQRGEFTAMLAHDIRNPIGLILNCTELLLDHNGPAVDPATTDKCLRRIRDDARILESLVSNYLHASRIEAGQLNISRHSVDLTALLRRTVERYECAAQPKSIRLDIAVRNDCEILGDGLALDRVFGNLLNNAVKFTPSGRAIRVGLERCRGDAVVTVSDTGPGVDPKKLSSLFQKFNRIEIAECQEGVGLGLYIVKELVAAHGGRVDAHSALGQGSCFAVSLPLNGRGHVMVASPANF